MSDFHSIVVNGDQVTVPDLPGYDGYKWFSETILDGQVPVWAPCGLMLNPVRGNIAQNKSIAVMNNSFLETPLALIAKTHNVLFTGLTRKYNIVHMAPFNYAASGLEGKQYWKTSPIWEQGRPGKPIKALAQEDYFCTILKGATVRFYACMDTGYHSMAENHERLGQLHDGKEYTAIASEHTLNNYVHVCYWDGHNIRVIYDNGMTPELLQSMWKEAESYGFTNPDKDW